MRVKVIGRGMEGDTYLRDFTRISREGEVDDRIEMEG
jgi:hypothetical protein